MTIPLDTLRKHIANTIWAKVSAPNVPSVCRALGIQENVQEDDASDAFRSKRGYVRKHLLKKDKAALLQIAANVPTEFDSEELEGNLLGEMTTQAEHRVSQVTRKDVLKALNGAGHLSGERWLIDLLSAVFGKESSRATFSIC
jgi:hypothetical protein